MAQIVPDRPVGKCGICGKTKPFSNIPRTMKGLDFPERTPIPTLSGEAPLIGHTFDPQLNARAFYPINHWCVCVTPV